MTSSPTGGSRPSGTATTRIEREHFLLQLPFEWKLVPSEPPLEFEFRNQTLPEQLIVTVLLTKEAFSQSQFRQIAEQLCEARLTALSQVSAGRAVAAPVKYQDGSNQVEARCIATDEEKNVRYAWVVRVTAEKVVTVALTRYTTHQVGPPFDVYAGLIFDFLQVKARGAGNASM